MKAVVTAREFAEEQRGKANSQSNVEGPERKRTRASLSGQVKEVYAECKEVPTKRKSYSLTTLRRIGYDPVAVKNGALRLSDASAARKVILSWLPFKTCT